ncbi:Multiple sugar-binding transport ATP-binding protein msmK [Lactobacillus taiwanensis DSM 21401]|jgi:ABC-type sugar transport systems, ATPase components|uniref:Sugar ABC transporter ATP-binding protein n=1 Tax=Lactobacillus taiwanensis TaxID=508451 RepID=A0A256LDK6_9LACO|nr:sn-glycerol-3-phosphate ABC transporter ATP-binding protein UgpC [Lactobacillus taiwanensis]KRN00797.1 Multiple sugar-binding transport ATP-binding protein msmK [Lactobacillus taiwanensis DSM 21401]MCR1902392.1 sn-glycerol-3-phosphate ABC transporter ATP-binding protein UgpC [Lactobacillus taiwanensis]MCR1915881.1 sn-glycerol-3-phosphate ABC transporter ATP-binding protein UgpC [Lactobacillus taiwanensis]MRM98151.1 sn-glycerol-3-phosphate ABC transporter ATP-binding protein UgpC [Lactobacill
MVEVDLNHIYKKYEGNDKYSVNDFDLHIKDKEFIVFVGPSGCGKSTTLRMVAGLEDISKGTLEIDHKVMNDVAPKDRDIAMVFQNYALYPHMSIYDNMAFGLKLRHYKKDEIDKRVKHAADILGLSEYLDKKPSELSGGQRQRVALGRAIVRDAPIFLMDEPLSNLDAKLRVTMRAEIAKLHQNLGTTTIYVTHDQTEAMTLADRVVVMSVGKVQQIGTPLEVYNTPVNMFVAGFIGSPQMNFFNVHFKGNRISDGKGLNIEIPEGKAKMLREKGYEDKDLVFGIRPEDIHSEEAFLETWPNSVVESTVVVSELLGSTIQLYQKVDGTEFVAIVNARDYHTPGDKVRMGFDVNKAHFFDKDTTNAIR